MTARLILLALDGADSDLIDRWSLDGTLPNIGRLRARGSAHHMEAPHGVTDDALWADFQYASGMGAHGRFHYTKRLKSTGRYGMSFLEEGELEAFWRGISDAGRRVAVIDVPKTQAPRPINGIHLADWLVHGRYFREPRSYPEGVAAEVVAKFGALPPSRCGYLATVDEGERRDALANLFLSIEQKERAGLHFLASEPWDLFILAFRESHCVDHHFWDVVDETHPHYDPALRERLGDPVRSIYVRLDAALGRLIEAAGPEAKVVLFSTTKMEPNASLAHLDAKLGERLNWRFSPTLAIPFARRSRRVRLPIEILPYGENGTAVRVNGSARKRERLLRVLEAEFAGLTNAETGEKLMDRMYRPSVEYPGARAAELPDLLVRYRAGQIPSAIRGPRIGRLEAPAPNYRPGNHACGPFIVAAGANVTDVRRLDQFGGLAERLLA